MTGKSESDMFGDQTMGSTTIVEALRDANEDKNVVAIVLRVDSPGGSALASDLIWHETQVIKKPIVASMGDVAASGGYYISMGADKIIAAPGTITGSIGVVGGKMAINGLYDKIGITTETIERGKNSGLFSSSGKFTDSQREVVKKMMEDIYDQFTDEGRRRAARCRSKNSANWPAAASTRAARPRRTAWSTNSARCTTPIVEAKKLAGLEADAEVQDRSPARADQLLRIAVRRPGAEKEVRIGQGLESLSPEMVEHRPPSGPPPQGVRPAGGVRDAV